MPLVNCRNLWALSEVEFIINKRIHESVWTNGIGFDR